MQTAVRLSMAVVKCIKQFGEPEDTKLCLQSETLLKKGVSATDELAMVEDCRTFFKMLYSVLSKSVTKYMNKEKKYSKAALVSTIYHSARLGRRIDLCSVQHTQVSQM